MKTNINKQRSTTAVKRALELNGMTDKKIEEVIQTLREIQNVKPARVTRKVATRIVRATPNLGDTALVMRTPSGYRVFTPEGHSALSENIKKHKPWLKSPNQTGKVTVKP